MNEGAGVTDKLWVGKLYFGKAEENRVDWVRNPINPAWRVPSSDIGIRQMAGWVTIWLAAACLYM